MLSLPVSLLLEAGHEPFDPHFAQVEERHPTA